MMEQDKMLDYDDIEEIVDEEVLEIIVDDIEETRIDRYLASLLPNYSRTYLKSLIEDNRVLVSTKSVKTSFKVSKGMKITIHIPPLKEIEILPENIPLNILYEDEDVVLINKPKNMVVHPSIGHYSGTLVNGLLFHCKNRLSGMNGELRPGIVHRIDKDTTGVIVVCKNDRAHRLVAEQLKAHSITRKYLAIVHGSFKEGEGKIEAPIGRHPTDRKKMAINDKNGKNAVTHYKILQNYFLKNGQTYSLVECRLETGRTHQIRVHLSSIGHPLVGDEIYGRGKNPFHLEGQALHAMILGFQHPKTGEYMEFKAELPEYFTELLKKLDMMSK